MEKLQLSEPEQRYYGDLFLLCSNGDNSTSVPIVKACELFRTSKLPNDVLRQITDLCSCNKTSELVRKEFYMALKLIAAAQAGLPVSFDTINNGLEVGLPRFTWPSDETTDLIQLREAAGENSPSASSTASDSPTPTNSVQDKVWAATSAWKGVVSEEQRQLLGTEEESSDRHSSSEEAESDSIWTMTNEQRDYYTTQFHSLQQKRPNGLLPGSVARLFFEKSRLPVNELRKIWQLADVTKDGALSLEEFNVAMHLVVLRRNQIPLPETLPPSLIPVQSQQPKEEAPASPGQMSISSETRGSKQWTKFAESPTSSLSSPGPKPVNFDFHKSAVEQDPKIYHPVPVRVTPEHPADVENDLRTNGDPAPEIPTSGKKILLQSYSADSGDVRPIRPIQRPTPRKPPPGPGAIPPPPDDLSGPTSLPVICPKKEPPPPPPPRPFRTHARSSSLDLNHIGRSNSLHAPPALPPRVSPNSTSPKKLASREGDPGMFPGGEDEGIAEVDGAPRRHGAFHVYRKHNNHCSPAEGGLQSGDMKRLEVQNSALALLCLQLNQELIQVQEERNVLQVKLEKLQARYDA